MTDKGAGEGTVRRLARRFVPGLETFSRYEASWLPRDLAAGLSIAAVALPVGIAYADLAGVPAVYGMYAAIFPLFAYALFGSSRQLMVGPDGATCILVAAMLGPLAGSDPDRYLTLVVVLTLMTGVLYIVGGLLRLGFIANFLSQPILVGFLNGVALIIMAGQIEKLLGYKAEAGDFFPELLELVQKLGQTNPSTLILGLVLLVLMLVMKRFVPRVPGGLVVVIVGILAVAAFGLEGKGVSVLGTVPAGLPSFDLPGFRLSLFDELIGSAAVLVLVSFTSGILTAKSFARRNRYDINPDQEMIAFGAANFASGLASGYPVTGADSRTAVGNTMGGKSQMMGIFAAVTMLLVLFFLTDPLALVPDAALAAVIIVAAYGLLDIGALRELYTMSYREFALSVGTTIGALVFGVLPGVIVAVALSIVWLLMMTSRPSDAVLGRVEGMKGFHATKDHPDATTVPGLLIYRFDSDLVFFNVDYFRDRLRKAVDESETPVEWVVVDVSPINIVDATAINKIDDLRQELAARGIELRFARTKSGLRRFFRKEWTKAFTEARAAIVFPTLRSAVKAFNKRDKAEPHLRDDIEIAAASHTPST